MEGCPGSEGLSAYFDCRCGAEEAKGIESHLRGCSCCRLRLRSMGACRSALRAAPVPAMPEGLARALRKMAAGQEGHAVPGVLWPRLRFAFALSAAAAFLIGFGFWVKISGVFLPKIDVPVDLVAAAHNQYALTMPLAPVEEIAAEMPAQLARAGEGTDVY
jgi:anti-sigma factor RsiW